MLTEQRYEEIYHLLEREGSVRTITLCNALQTSRETIRRDLEAMEAKGMLRRIRGGAMKLDMSQNKNVTYTSFSKRRDENLSHKEDIALEALNYISEGQAIALDSGTTSLFLARALKTRFHSLTVVTNSFAVAQELAGAEGITLVLTGGVYRADEEAFVSDMAALIFSKINVDTDLRLAMTAAIRKAFAEDPSVFDPRKYMLPARELIQKTVEHKIKDVFGSSNKA